MAKPAVAARSARSKSTPVAKSTPKMKVVSSKQPGKLVAQPETQKPTLKLGKEELMQPAAKPAVSERKLPETPTQGQRLAEEELVTVWKTYKKTRDDNLRNILIEHHMPLVRMIAERVLQTLPKSIELDDLTSAGTFGLMDAINGFDLSRGIKFKTYCTTRIRGSILDELRSQDWVPRLVRLKAHKLERATRQLEGQLGRLPNQAELAKELGLTMEELQDHQNEASARTIFSLSEKWDDGDDDKEMEKIEILADKKCENPVETIQSRDALDTITRNLTKKERLIILMYYYEGLTMREIGEIMELTESRVCQIHSNVMARLKAQLDRVQLQQG
jgi:RNA polymerase sigma factor for flagellar operon FliA